ncbi:hypothetical protein HDU80_011137 [Chytriomyces hyalinus]|nr:hypothetical protein HDU80_011137 [Chytriomyces hyalinus]
MYLSSDILKTQSSPRMHRIFLTLLYTTPFTCMLPTIVQLCTLPLTVAESEKYYNIVNFASGGVVTTLDAFFTVAFYSYLVKYTSSTAADLPCSESNNNNGARLKIIARYGLISSCFCFIALGGFVTLMTAFFLDPSLTNPSAWKVYSYAQMTVDLSSVGIVSAPIIMKVRLHQVAMSASNLHRAAGHGSKKYINASGMDSESAGAAQKMHSSLRAHSNVPI